MAWIRGVLLAVLTALVFLLGYTGRLDPWKERAKDVYAQAFYAKTYNVDGLRILSENDVLVELPVERSVVWWLMNLSSIGRSLEAHPLIEHASVARCDTFALRCFTISIKERTAQYVAIIGTTAWLVGDDGNFMGPAPESLVQDESSRASFKPVIIRGAAVESDSPDVTKARLAHIRQALRIIENETEFQASSATLEDSGDLAVKFRQHSFLATFELRDKEDDRLAEEARRLKTLVSQLGAKLHLVKSVDLAFDKMAVVKMVE